MRIPRRQGHSVQSIVLPASAIAGPGRRIPVPSRVGPNGRDLNLPQEIEPPGEAASLEKRPQVQRNSSYGLAPRSARERYSLGAGLGLASPARSPRDQRTWSCHIFWTSGRSHTS